MKKALIIFITCFVTVYPQTLKTKLENLFNDKFFERCLISIQVEDLTANKTLYKKNEKLLLRPASNMKIITSAAGLLYLGADYEFKTDLFYNGYISKDTLHGYLFFVGGCDPDFVTQDFYPFVDAIKSLNISAVNGNLYADVSFKDSLYWGKGWMWDDDPSSDAPYLSALNLNDNCVSVSFYGTNDSISISPNTNFVKVHRVYDTTNLSIDRNWLNRTNDIIIKGKIDRKNYNSKVNVLEPAKYFLTVFSEVLDSNKITVSGQIGIKKIPTDVTPLFSFGRKYSDIINNLNKSSDNLSAEMTLYALSERYSGKPATADSGIQLIRMMIDSTGLVNKDYRLVEGSGVSHYNVVSAELLVNILKYFYDKKPELYKLLYNSFPIAGVDGTLEYRMRKIPLLNNVHAKTGTLTGVSSLSGYLTNSKNHILAFSILMQNFVGPSSRARDLQDEICKILAGSK